MLYRALIIALVVPFVPTAAHADENAKRIGLVEEAHIVMRQVKCD